MEKAWNFACRYPLTLLCLALVWYLSLFFMPPETPLNDVAFIDKYTHIVMYGGTTAVMWWEYLRCHDRLSWRRLLLFAFLMPIVMSGCIELMQEYLTVNRSGEWLDFAANSVGVALGNGFGLAFRRVS